MTGKGHLVFGLSSAILAFVASGAENVPENLGASLAVGALSALAPDLDEAGSTLSGKIYRFVRKGTFSLLVGTIAATLFLGAENFPFAFACATLSVLVLHMIIRVMGEKRARKVAISALGALGILSGLYFSKPFLLVFGIFILISPWTRHRTATHTVWALALWSFACFDLERCTGLEGVFAAGCASYASHILADSATKARTKPLWPLSRLSFGIPIVRMGSRGGAVVEYVATVVFLALSLAVYALVFGWS